MSNNKSYKIYKITNIINDKIYIGITCALLSNRWCKHCSEAKNLQDSPRPILRAIRKYGKENFKIEQLDTAPSEQEALKKETDYILKFNSIDGKVGYNACSISSEHSLNEYARLQRSSTMRQTLSNKFERPMVSKDEIVKMYQDQKLSTKDISEHFKITQEYVRKILKELNLYKSESKCLSNEELILIDNYLLEGLNPDQIAEKLNRPIKTVQEKVKLSKNFSPGNYKKYTQIKHINGMRNLWSAKTGIDPLEFDQKIISMYQEGTSIYTISKYLNSSYTQVNRILVRYGLKSDKSQV